MNSFNKETKEFTVYLHDPDNPKSLSSNNVSAVCVDHKGLVWVGTWGQGINVLNTETNQFTCFRHIPDNDKSISNDMIMRLYCDHSGNVWAGTWGGGLNLAIQPVESSRKLNHTSDIHRTQFTSYQTSESDLSSISSNIIYSIFQDRTGMIWAGTGWGGVNKFEKTNEKFKHIYITEGDKDSFDSNMDARPHR